MLTKTYNEKKISGNSVLLNYIIETMFNNSIYKEYLLDKLINHINIFHIAFERGFIFS
nr:hypothetical protein [Brachyspira hyodysenteriae]